HKEDVELASASVQFGLQNEAQFGMGRLGIQATPTTRATVETFTGRVAAGIHNPDGSTGLNASIGAAAMSVGASYEKGEVAAAASVGVGVGVGGSVGFKEGVNGGDPRLCVSAPIGPVTAGGCVPVSVPAGHQNDGQDNGAEGTGGTDNGAGGASGR